MENTNENTRGNLISAPSSLDESQSSNTSGQGLISSISSLFSSRSSSNENPSESPVESEFIRPKTSTRDYTSVFSNNSVKSAAAATSVAGVATSGTWTRSLLQILLLIVLLAILGLNVFSFLGYTVDLASMSIKRIGSSAAPVVGGVVKTTAENTGVGAKIGANVAAGTVNTTVDLALGNPVTQTPGGTASTQQTSTKNTNSKKMQNTQDIMDKVLSPSLDNSDMETVKPRACGSKFSPGEAVWCYVGSEGGERICAKTTSNQCESKQVFARRDICVNPSLRK